MNNIKEQLREWIMQKRKIRNSDGVLDNTLLLETGLLRSIDITDLILFIEFARNEPIRITDLQPGVFTSINSIANQFFAREKS